MGLRSSILNRMWARAITSNPNMRLEATDADSAGTLGAARHSRECLGSDENSAILIEGAFSVVSITRYLLNYFAIRLKNNAICSE